MPRPLFSLGQLLATPGAIGALQQSHQTPLDFVLRHQQGDWGEVCHEDKTLNDQSVKDGSRILSVYRTSKGEKLWVITEGIDQYGHRAATTCLLPDEY